MLADFLRTLGERDESPERLCDAVAVFRAAFEVHTKDRLPLQWATIRLRLGVTRLVPGRIEQRCDIVYESIEDLQAALEILDGSNDPNQSARARQVLRGALRAYEELLCEER